MKSMPLFSRPGASRAMFFLALGAVLALGTLPAGAQLKREDVVGRGVVAAIYEGEPVLETRLAAVGAGAGLLSFSYC